jgi:gentisate 1,2-dioxygenase
MWRYDQIRPYVMEAGRVITAKEAERRVLILENPGLRGASRITQSLYAGLQLILPGEEALSHRHVASALRFIVEGQGAYTAVDGQRATMHPGDLILTPSWTYHDHGNPGAEPVIWLDGLDIPTVNTFDSSFAEREPEAEEGDVPPASKAGGASRLRATRFGAQGREAGGGEAVFSYPYATSRERLEQMRRAGAPDPSVGYHMQYEMTKQYPMPTMAAFLQLLPAGFQGTPRRATDGTVFCVVEGRGKTRIGDRIFDWGPRDIFVAPSWHPVAHEAEGESVLFSFSDRPAQLALGLWRQGDAT